MSSSPYHQRQATRRRRELDARAHHLRHNPTFTEQLLWRELRGSRLGVAFRRQVVIGRPAHRLVIEVDGGVHANRTHLDAIRDTHLRRAGYRTLHIPADLIRTNLPAAIALIRAAL